MKFVPVGIHLSTMGHSSCLSSTEDYQISSRAGMEVQDLMKSFLVKNPDDRSDIHEMKASAWLKDVDFGKLAKKKFTAPASEQKQ